MPIGILSNALLLPFISIHSESPVLIFEYISVNVADVARVPLPAAASVTPSLVAAGPTTASSVESFVNVKPTLSPFASLIKMMSPSTTTSVPSFLASSFALSMHDMTLALSMPWTTNAPVGFGSPTPFTPAETDVIVSIGLKPHAALNFSMPGAACAMSFGSTNCFHRSLFWSCAQLRPITTSESSGRSARSPAFAFTDGVAAGTLSTGLPMPGSAGLSAAFGSSFLQAPPANAREATATSHM